MAPSPSGGSSSFSPLGPSRGGPAGILSFYSMPALLHFRNSTASGALGLNAFSHLWTFWVSFVFPPPALVPLVLSKFLAEHVNGKLRHLILMAPCWMEAPWHPHSSQHVGRCSLAVPHHKRSRHGCFGRPGSQRSAISTFNPLAAQQCVLHRQGFSSSVCQMVVGATQTSTQRSTSSAGKNGPVGVLNRVYQTMPSLPLN